MFDSYYKKLNKKNIDNQCYINKIWNIILEVDNHFNSLSVDEIKEFSIFEKYYNFLYRYNKGELSQHTINKMKYLLSEGEDFIIFEDLGYFSEEDALELKKYGCDSLPPYLSDFVDKNLQINLDFLYHCEVFKNFKFKHINIESILKNNIKISHSKPFNEVYFSKKFPSGLKLLNSLDSIFLFDKEKIEIRLFYFLLNSSDIYNSITFEIYKYYKNIQKLPKRSAKHNTENLVMFMKKELTQLIFPIENTLPVYNTIILPESIEKIDNLEKLSLTREFNILSSHQQREVFENVISDVFVLNTRNKEESKKMIYSLIENIF